MLLVQNKKTEFNFKVYTTDFFICLIEFTLDTDLNGKKMEISFLDQRQKKWKKKENFFFAPCFYRPNT